MITTDELARMVVEIETGKPPSRTDPEASAMRAKLKSECEQIKAKGGAVMVPFELPDLD
jgi:hypothetical protein